MSFPKRLRFLFLFIGIYLVVFWVSLKKFDSNDLSFGNKNDNFHSLVQRVDNAQINTKSTRNAQMNTTPGGLNNDYEEKEGEKVMKTHQTTTNSTKKIEQKTEEQSLNATQNETSTNNKLYKGRWTKANQTTELNRTKIVGFITGNYAKIALRWYNRLELLGYNNHYIVCIQEETYKLYRESFPNVRTEISTLPPFPEELKKLPYAKKIRARLTMLFAHRWHYMLRELKEGHHILLTDVDNIFSAFHDTAVMESSPYDIYHALETKYPEDVFRHQGFVVCGGMGWFRSSPQTISVIEQMIQKCGILCDDQIILNQLIAYNLNIDWNTSNTSPSTDNDNHTTTLTVDADVRISELKTKGFTGRSDTLGLRVKVWDRDFAYRGKNDPNACPHKNWVSMPLVVARGRWRTISAKLKSYDIWDKACPNTTYTQNFEKLSRRNQYKHTLDYYRNVHAFDSVGQVI